MRMYTIATALALTACTAAFGQRAETPVLKTGTPPLQATVSSRDALIARAKSLELNTPYVPPPGDPLEHHTSGYGKIMCSAVFITGLDPDFAAENVGYFTSPYAERAKVGKPVIDRVHKAVISPQSNSGAVCQTPLHGHGPWVMFCPKTRSPRSSMRPR